MEQHTSKNENPSWNTKSSFYLEKSCVKIPIYI